MNSILTRSLIQEIFTLVEEITPPWMDKKGKNPSIITPFSSGGTDDKISLVLVPLIASAGVTVSKVLESLTSFGQFY